MAKRKNRIPPIDHERRALAKLKEIEPNVTPEAYRPLSDALADLAVLALDEMENLENGAAPSSERLQTIVDTAQRLLQGIGE